MRIKPFLIVATFLLAFFIPQAHVLADCVSDCNSNMVWTASKRAECVASCSQGNFVQTDPNGASTDTTIRLDNPLVSGDPRVIAGNLIRAMLSITGSISLLMFVYGGVLWITAMGNEKTIDKGKKVLIWAVIGLAVIAGAYTLTNAVIYGLTTGSVSGL